MRVKCIYGGKVVTPEKVIDAGTVLIEDGIIIEIMDTTKKYVGAENINADGRWILPGFIDTHSDAIEVEMQPRPGSIFPMELAFAELERKLVSQGITHIYHALSMHGENAKSWTRKNETVKSLIQTIYSLKNERQLIHHYVHLRFDLTNLAAASVIAELMEEEMVDQLSFNDHTPGQGQYRDIEKHKEKLMTNQNISKEVSEKLIAERIGRPKVDFDQMKEIATLANNKGIPIASHDDDSLQKLDIVQDHLFASISEFPVELEVAKEAKQRGMYVIMGAPNVILGRSHSNNLSAQKAIEEGAVDILCTDYYPPSLLQAVFLLSKKGYAMNHLVNMVSLNPAKALRMERRRGSLELGKQADVLLVSEHKGFPFIDKVLVDGHLVCQLDYYLAQKTGSADSIASLMPFG